jgi:hypothetical protein
MYDCHQTRDDLVFVNSVSTLRHIEVRDTGRPKGLTMPSLNRNRLLLCSLTMALSLPMMPRMARAEMDPTPLLQQALRFRVTIHTNRRTGYMVAAAHCRRASEGCDRRLFEFAHYLRDAGERNGIDPWLLAAMAFRESGLNPFAVGGVGELGILQLHPRSPTSKNIRFVKDGWYRLRCKREAGACQREVVDRAAEVLARAVVLCGGDMDRALSAYNTGRCGGNTSYAKRVRREVEWLKGAVGLSRIEQLAEDARAADPAAAIDAADAAEQAEAAEQTGASERVGAAEQAGATEQAAAHEQTDATGQAAATARAESSGRARLVRTATGR